MEQALVEDVLDRLGVTAIAKADIDDLHRLYAAWCEVVPFDNIRKIIHVAEGCDGPLPGSTAEDFFASWLEHGTGGTCWAGNGALHDLLAAVGFEVERATATMLPGPELESPNHGSVVVTIDGDRWIADASILSGKPLRIPDPAEPPTGGPLPRLEWRDGNPTILWRMLSAPRGFPCRFERFGIPANEWDALHLRTAEWGPFNFALNVRAVRGSSSIGYAAGQRFTFAADGSFTAEPRDRSGRDRFLVEELGISAGLVSKLPEDRPTPPRPTA